jgi:hypothetical protein
MSEQHEVCQMKISQQQDGKITQIQCDHSTIRSRYLISFPNRYLQCLTNIDRNMKIYYRSDGVWSNLTNIERPLLFYALDDVSGVMNIGSLDMNKYTARWMTSSTGRCNCSWNDATSGVRPRLMTFVPTEITMASSES